MNADLIPYIFVYGTLKRGQHRESQWPHRPVRISPAWTLGRLYDVGPYPALVPGEDRVGGQLWELYPDHLRETLQVLDMIEGTNQADEVNEYDRIIAEVHEKNGRTRLAQMYLFAQKDRVHQFEYVPATVDWAGHVYSIWPLDSKWE